MATENNLETNVTENQQTADIKDTQEKKDNAGTEKEEVTIESLMAELAQSKANEAKTKATLDKALREKGEITKALRAKQTAEEQEVEARKEAEEQQKAYIKELETFKRKAEARARYALQGMSEEFASKAAEAEIEGDMDTLATIQKQYREQSIKAAEAEWLKSIPQPQVGNGSGEEVEDAFIKGFNSVSPRFK